MEKIDYFTIKEHHTTHVCGTLHTYHGNKDEIARKNKLMVFGLWCDSFPAQIDFEIPTGVLDKALGKLADGGFVYRP